MRQPFPPLPFLLFLDPPWSCQRFHLFASNSNSERKRENKVCWQRVKWNLTGGQDSPDREKGHSQWDQHQNSFKGNTSETSKRWGELAHMGFPMCVHTILKLKGSQLASKGLNKALTELAGRKISKTKLPGWQGAKSSHYSTGWQFHHSTGWQPHHSTGWQGAKSSHHSIVWQPHHSTGWQGDKSSHYSTGWQGAKSSHYSTGWQGAKSSHYWLARG